MKTAVEQLYNLIESIPSGVEELNQMKELLISKKPLFKEMEKEQMIKFGCSLIGETLKEFVLETYNETYGGNK